MRGFQVEIRLHLEDLGKFLVVGLQQVIEQRIAEQEDTQTDRDRFRLERRRRDQAVKLGNVFNYDLPPLDDALQRIPGKGVAQHIQDIDHQIPAVGLEYRTRLDEGEVGGEEAVARYFLDTPDQVVI